jgi:transposase
MKKTNIIGADLSKKTIDLYCHDTKAHLTISNNLPGFKSMVKWLVYQSIQLHDVIIVMEHTGLYSYCFEDFLHVNHVKFTKVTALEIKLSMGVVRGKSDKIDAKKIAHFGSEKKTKLTHSPPVEKDLKRLQMLMSGKNLLVKQRASLLCSIKEYQNIGISDKDLILKTQLAVIKELTKQIDLLEADIKLIIKSNLSLNNNYQLLTSIIGVGPVVATTTIIKTHNFERFANARKFACFCGTAPFPNESGSSIRKKTKISHLADKQMKTLLDLAARSAMQYDEELKNYYQNRLAIGKSKRSTINVIRNKIIARMFAVIKRQTPYVENYLEAA